MKALIDYLADKPDQQFLIIETRTPVKLKKTGNDGSKNTLGDVFKLSSALVVVNYDYTDAVNEQRVAEGTVPTFEIKPRVWGKATGAIVTHETTGVQYLNAMMHTQYKSVYTNSSGNTLDKATVFNYMTPKPLGNINQGLVNPVEVRTYKLDNIIGYTPVSGELPDDELTAIAQYKARPKPVFGPCGCMGPQRINSNDPLDFRKHPRCPCAMKTVEVVNGKYYQIADVNGVFVASYIEKVE